MSRKSLKILLILVTILSLISTFSFATDGTPVATSEDATVLSVENPEATEGTESENAENTTTEGTTENATTPEGGKEVNNDLYLSEDEVTISDTVNGNAFIMADTLTITGQIGGDLFVMAKTINLDGGQVYGNVFAVAETITLNGLIYDLYAVCDTLNVSYDGVAYRDLKVTCDTATINGVVGKNVNISASKGLTLEADCVVYGDLNYSAPSEIEVAEGMVTGTVNYEKASSVGLPTDAMDYFVLLFDAIFVLVIWLLISKFAPKFYGKVNGLTTKQMLLSPILGIVSFILAILIPMLLIITVVGIPVAFVLMVAYGLVIALGSAIFTIVLGNKLGNKVKVLGKLHNLLAILLVAVVLSLTTFIPFVGEWLAVLYTIIGVGMFLMSAFNKKEKTVEPVAEAPVQE